MLRCPCARGTVPARRRLLAFPGGSVGGAPGARRGGPGGPSSGPAALGALAPPLPLTLRARGVALFASPAAAVA
eukprot:12316067-Alexandrium_andersonii.AAC.1